MHKSSAIITTAAILITAIATASGAPSGKPERSVATDPEYSRPIQATPCLMRAGAIVHVDTGHDTGSTWTLTDTDDKEIACGPADGPEIGIDTAGLESGLYVITIKTGAQSRSARIIVL